MEAQSSSNTEDIVKSPNKYRETEGTSGDALITTDDSVLLENTKELPAIICVQRKAEKKIITEELLAEANRNSFGDEIGSTTNHITAMYDLLPLFDKDSPEYKSLEYRIMCGQYFQQNCIDKTKGIIAKPMPDYWYLKNKCRVSDDDTDDIRQQKDFNASICADKKPYFMNYVYPEQMSAYRQYIKSTNKKCIMRYHMDVDELIQKSNRSDNENDFLSWYYKMMPVSDNGSVMNKICHRIEEEFDGYFSAVKAAGDFDYSIMKIGVQYSKNDYRKIRDIYERYLKKTVEFQVKSKQQRLDKDDTTIQFMILREEFRKECRLLCTNKYELCDIILDICYRSSHSKQFAWEMCADTIIENLLKKNDNEISYVYKDNDGDIEYCGERFSRGRIKVKDHDNS